jgi:hypothetical protein
MRIAIADVRRICELLLTHLEQSGRGSIDLTNDFYWNIPQEQLYRPYEEPDVTDVGQLSDDWAELQAILRGQKEPLGYALVWLSSILRAIGEDNVG